MWFSFMLRSISMSVWQFVCGGFMMCSLLRKRDFFLFFICSCGGRFLVGGGWIISLCRGCVMEVDLNKVQEDLVGYSSRPFVIVQLKISYRYGWRLDSAVCIFSCEVSGDRSSAYDSS